MSTKRKRMLLKSRYGVSSEQYEKLVQAQSGCWLCGGSSSNGKALAIDHDHQTNRVRGLLCNNCNLALGEHVTQEWLQSAVDYLEIHAV